VIFTGDVLCSLRNVDGGVEWKATGVACIGVHIICYFS
jgi:hypothetical protein